MTDFVAELRSLRTQAFRRLLHNADFRVLLALDRALADLEDPSADLSMVGEDGVLPTLRQTDTTATAAAPQDRAADDAPAGADAGQDMFAEEAASAEEAQRLLDEVERARAGAIAAHRAVMEGGRDADDEFGPEGAANGVDAGHLNGDAGDKVNGEDPLTSIFTGPMPEAPPVPSEDTPIERLTPRDDAYEAALNRLNTLIERASNQLRATSG